MKWYTYDVEVFAHDFIVVFKDKQTKQYAVFHNDNEGVKEFITDEAIYCGFNSKGYDQYIIKAICNGFAPEDVKQVNDWIISGGQGWQCPLLDGAFFRFNNVDIADDMQMGLSLKAIEGHLGWSIEETEVDFNLDRPLTPEEIQLTIKYCKHDVDCTEHLTDLRKNYLNTKLSVGEMAGMTPLKALSMTNAKLTASFLGATKKPHDDERKYVIPDNLNLKYVPPDVLEFYKRIYDESIDSKNLFSSKLNVRFGDCDVVVSYGGIHGCIANYFWEAKEVVLNEDNA